MDPVRLQHRQVRITANRQRLPGQLRQPPRRQPGTHSGNVINPENRHAQTIARQVTAQQADSTAAGFPLFRRHRIAV